MSEPKPGVTLSVIIPAHNPDRSRMRRVLEALRLQDLPTSEWELILVDNRSTEPLEADALELRWHASARVVRENSIGLTHARVRGFREAQGELCVLVDDDNLFARDFLLRARDIATRCEQVGVFGGPVLPEFESAATRMDEGVPATPRAARPWLERDHRHMGRDVSGRAARLARAWSCGEGSRSNGSRRSSGIRDERNWIARERSWFQAETMISSLRR